MIARTSAAICFALLLVYPPAVAEADGPGQPAKQQVAGEEVRQTEGVQRHLPVKRPEAKAVLLTVAVLGYDIKWIDDPKESAELGRLWVTFVGTQLSALDGLTIVEQQHVAEVLKDHPFDRSQLQVAAKRVEVGRLLGARFLLTGKGFRRGEKILVTTEVVNVETGALKGLIVEFPGSTSGREIMTKVCRTLKEKLPAKIAELKSAGLRTLGPLEMVRDRLGVKARKWLVATAQKYKGKAVVDPAIQKELERLLSGANQEVESLRKAAAEAVVEGTRKIEAVAERAEYDFYVLADGVSEAVKELKDGLVACKASVQIKIVDARTGEVLASGSLGDLATDLQESDAARHSLRNATRRLFLDLLEEIKPAEQTEDKSREKAGPED